MVAIPAYEHTQDAAGTFTLNIPLLGIRRTGWLIHAAPNRAALSWAYEALSEFSRAEKGVLPMQNARRMPTNRGV